MQYAQTDYSLRMRKSQPGSPLKITFYSIQ